MTKFIGMDVHKESLSIAVMKCRWESGDEMCDRDQGEHDSAVHRRTAWRCARHVEEGAWAACKPRKNALLKDGRKSDRINARKLAGISDSPLGIREAWITAPLKQKLERATPQFDW
jgi:hypothetical protein